MKPAMLLAAMLMTAACDAMPADPDGTLQRIRGERRFRVGLIAPTLPPLAPERARAFVQGLSRATGATATMEEGAAEALLTRLEEGELDLVLGEFSEQSPWAPKVTVTEPIAARGPIVLAAAARNGENAWISLVFREARAAAAVGE
jgi:hypothetical protein